MMDQSFETTKTSSSPQPTPPTNANDNADSNDVDTSRKADDNSTSVECVASSSSQESSLLLTQQSPPTTSFMPPPEHSPSSSASSSSALSCYQSPLTSMDQISTLSSSLKPKVKAIIEHQNDDLNDDDDDDDNDDDNDDQHEIEHEDNTNTNDYYIPSSPLDYMSRVERNKQRNLQKLKELGIHQTIVQQQQQQSKTATSSVQSISSEDDDNIFLSELVQITEEKEKLLVKQQQQLKSKGMIFPTKYNQKSLLFNNAKGQSNYFHPPMMNNNIQNQQSITTTTTFSSMNQTYPHRKQQIRLLRSCFNTTLRQTSSTSSLLNDNDHKITNTLSPHHQNNDIIYIPSPIFITGESGTGKTSIVKDLLYELQHKASTASAVSTVSTIHNNNNNNNNNNHNKRSCHQQEKIENHSTSITTSRVGLAYINCKTIGMESKNIVHALLQSAHEQLLHDFEYEHKNDGSNVVESGGGGGGGAGSKKRKSSSTSTIHTRGSKRPNQTTITTTKNNSMQVSDGFMNINNNKTHSQNTTPSTMLVQEHHHHHHHELFNYDEDDNGVHDNDDDDDNEDHQDDNIKHEDGDDNSDDQDDEEDWIEKKKQLYVKKKHIKKKKKNRTVQHTIQKYSKGNKRSILPPPSSSTTTTSTRNSINFVEENLLTLDNRRRSGRLKESSSTVRTTTNTTTTTQHHQSLYGNNTLNYNNKSNKNKKKKKIQTPMAFGRSITKYCGTTKYGSLHKHCAFIILDHAETLLDPTANNIGISCTRTTSSSSIAGVGCGNNGSGGTSSISAQQKSQRMNLLSQLLLLPKVMHLNLTIVVITDTFLLENTRINNILSNSKTFGSISDAINPIRCHFDAYRGKAVFKEILMTPHLRQSVIGESCATNPGTLWHQPIIVKLYESLAEIVIQSVESITRDVREMLRLLRLAWPYYLKPIVINDLTGKSLVSLLEESCASLSDENNDKVQLKGQVSEILGQKIRPRVRRMLNECLLQPGNTLQEVKEERSQESNENEIDLPYYSIFLLLAAYLCQVNKAENDLKLYTNRASGQRTRRGRGSKQPNDTQMESITHASSSKAQQNLKIEKIPSFPLERLLSIFSSITGKYASDENSTNKNLGSTTTFAKITELEELGYISCIHQNTASRKSHIMTTSTLKYHCKISKNQAVQFAKQVHFPLSNYLTENL